MNTIISIISFFWLIRTLKAVLFWIYLWQLKDYHIGRFRDHFRTTKGKTLLLHPLLGLKIAILLVSYWFLPILYAIMIIYALEMILFLWAMMRRTTKKPVTTFKTIFLVTLGVGTVIIFLWYLEYLALSVIPFIFWLLVFDIITPLIISLLVLIVQPCFVFLRNRILAKARKKMAELQHITVIGITGSYGKTATKEFLTTILSTKYRVVATPEHQNSEIGIAQTILQKVHPKHEIFVVEMGAYNKGGIQLLCDIVRPRIGIVTGVNVQHLATFGSLENLLSAEGGGELLAHLPQDGLLVVNGDNAHCLRLYKKATIAKKLYASGRHAINADLWAEEITVTPDALDFMVMSKEGEATHYHLNVHGRQQIQNLLAAITVARGLGMTLEEIKTATQHITKEQTGMEVINGAYGIRVIDASYSANPDGVLADLEYLNVFIGKRVVVMPCLIELGETSANIHRELGRSIAEVADLLIVTTYEAFSSLRQGALEGGLSEKNIIYSEKPHDILNRITTFCKKDDVVLLEGRVPNELIKKLKK